MHTKKAFATISCIFEKGMRRIRKDLVGFKLVYQQLDLYKAKNRNPIELLKCMQILLDGLLFNRYIKAESVESYINT